MQNAELPALQNLADVSAAAVSTLFSALTLAFLSSFFCFHFPVLQALVKWCFFPDIYHTLHLRHCIAYVLHPRKTQLNCDFLFHSSHSIFFFFSHHCFLTQFSLATAISEAALKSSSKSTVELPAVGRSWKSFFFLRIRILQA